MHATALSLLAVSAITLCAQAQSPVGIPRPEEPGISNPILGGIGLGLTGFFIGGFLGSKIDSRRGCYEECGLEGAVYGAAAGGTLGMALGVHLGNRQRGEFGPVLIGGAAVWAAGIFLANRASHSGTSSTAILVAIPIVQLIATVSIEQATGRKRDREAGQAPEISLVPRPHGAGLFVAVPLPHIR